MTDTNDLINKIPGWKAADVKVTQLSGGITNQNYRVDIRDESFVLRVCGKNASQLGIVRDNETACTQIVSKLGIAPETFHFLPEEGLIVTRFIKGKSVSAETAREPQLMERILKSIKIYHEGPSFPGEFSVAKTVQNYKERAQKNETEIPEKALQGLQIMNEIETVFQSRNEKQVPCHNDLLAGNFLDDGDKIWIIDWEYAAMGNRYFDLGNFSVMQEMDEDQDHFLIKTYFGEVTDERMACLKLMKTASDLRESFWAYLQSGISELDFDYPEYAEKHLDRFMSVATSDLFTKWLQDSRKTS